MIRDIKIGQNYPSHSVLHRLDPRTKIMGTVFFIISLFIGNSSPLCCTRGAPFFPPLLTFLTQAGGRATIAPTLWIRRRP